jgi:hypothetical protein
MEKKRNTAQGMYGLMAAYEKSGKKQREFCREQGIKKSTFGYWLRKYRACPAEAGSKETDALGFVEIEVNTPKKSLGDTGGVIIEIQYPQGHLVRFHELVPAAYLRSIVK